MAVIKNIPRKSPLRHHPQKYQQPLEARILSNLPAIIPLDWNQLNFLPRRGRSTNYIWEIKLGKYKQSEFPEALEEPRPPNFSPWENIN